MSILNLPTDNVIPSEMLCALCERRITPDCAMLGPINAEGKVAVLCAGHLWDGLNFIDKLADYMAEERKKFFRDNGNNVMRFGGGGQDAWFVY